VHKNLASVSVSYMKSVQRMNNKTEVVARMASLVVGGNAHWMCPVKQVNQNCSLWSCSP